MKEGEGVAGKQGRHLCRQWRAVAIKTLTLWTYFDFKEGPHFDKSRTWLERSKECPLDTCLPPTCPSCETSSFPILRGGAPRAHRERFSMLTSKPEAPELRAMPMRRQ